MSSTGMSASTPCMVPSATIARIFHDVAFKKKDTKITAPAVLLSGEYIRLFVQEAVLRANEQRLADLSSGPANGDEPKKDDLGDEENDEEDFDFDEEEDDHRGLGVSTQIEVDVPPMDVLEARHLAAVSGLLLMDF